MYINRKDETRVEAQHIYGNCPHCGHKTNCDYYQFAPIGVDFESNYDVLNSVEFESQYGKAMICLDGKKDYCEGCNSRDIHIEENFCAYTDNDCPKCIPYIPEEQKVDNEPTFPICGTCNAQKDAYLLLPPEKIRDILQTGGTPFDFSMEIARAELDHLAKLGIVYVKKECPYILSNCQGGGRCPDEFKWDGCVKSIPLSDYLKGEKKE